MQGIVANANNKKIGKLSRSIFENKDTFVKQLVLFMIERRGSVEFSLWYIYSKFKYWATSL